MKLSIRNTLLTNLIKPNKSISNKLYINTILTSNFTSGSSISKYPDSLINLKKLTQSTFLNPMDPNFDYSKLFSDESLEQLQKNLQKNLSSSPNYRFKYDSDEEVLEASVLLLLCMSNGEPSVLFTERSSKLKNHSKEISFPGGKRDLTDGSLLETALRETEEEVGIDRLDIKILGSMPPLPNYNFTIKVYPTVGLLNFNLLDKTNGFYDEAKVHQYTGKTLDLSRLNLSVDEVESVFTIPLSHLLSEQGVVAWDTFRSTPIQFPRYNTPNQVQSDIWGLTAAFLFQFLKIWFPQHNANKL